MPHAADRYLHRKLKLDEAMRQLYGSDVSYVAQYSPKKANYLQRFLAAMPEADLKIWGPGWNSCQLKELQKYIVPAKPPFGDYYVAVINATKINLAIMNEAVLESPCGDMITSRTFHIPASGGFMLHERTEEIARFYKEGKEIGCFADPEEMAEKTRYYLAHEEERLALKEAAYQRTQQEDMWSHRAAFIEKSLYEKNVLK